MKKLAIAALSCTFVMGSLLPITEAFAQDHRRPDRIEKKVVITKHSWKRGHRLSREERRRVQDVRDFRRYRLAPPPRGYRWVRADRDFLLISIGNGTISNVIGVR
ncbi:hypothetical protein BJF93_08895 [Xaviernesmea oryzae]|uniref:Uncharacterized protein n=1 Tax=Xaviernesmea oryzae TaxID=464029 RepID=A0A1Q9B145_9HYPH|nr:RcnB family protein [Xaviernesmea oryzae]OLP61706.1 hypothetical protein BJF93_08895 [Xaviernesmea oryzae]SEL01724.1 Nickel/cobalt transporter regulator [Xaviernesmea oryzae]